MKVCVRAECRPESRPSDERRVRADGQQRRQHGPQPVADLDRAVAALDADVDLQRERVVAPRDVLQAVLHAPVVLGVDDVLLAVVRQRVRAGGGERDAVGVGEREQPPARLALELQRVLDVLAAAGADLDLGGDQLAGDRDRRAPGPSAASARIASKRGTSSSVAGSTRPHSSSIPTVRSWEVSKTSRAASRSIGLRSGRSRARTGGRRPGSRCARSPRAAPAAAPRSS